MAVSAMMKKPELQKHTNEGEAAVGNTDLQTLEGQLLIASPQMADVRFRRSVVLLLHHDSDGAMGVILNQRLPAGADEYWDALGDAIRVGDHRAKMGGPVHGLITVLHDVKDGRTNDAHGRIYVLQKQEQLGKLVETLNDDPSIQFFVGHAGWSSGQLESEMAEGSWLSIPASPDLVFRHSDGDMWTLAMRAAGARFYSEVLGIHDPPPDATWN